ncbi:MAG: methyltransferase domain-containing protein [bacterium]|nr:methyltransferase domain-containing protein [bacterium]
MAEFLKVGEVLEGLHIKEDMVGAEFGCGSAVFTVALAKKMPKGKVYALDIQEEKLSALKGRLAKEGIHNVSMIHCDLEALGGSTLQDDSVDVVLIPTVLFQAENKSAMINEGKRVLKKAGQLLIIDWLKKGPFSPRSGMVSPDEIKKVTEGMGLSLKNESAVGDYHYALLFSKE